MKTKYLFFVITFFILFLAFFVKTSSAQICNPNPQLVSCKAYEARRGADNLWFCSTINNDDTFYCTTQPVGGLIKCGYWRHNISFYCNDGGGRAQKSQVVYQSCPDAGRRDVFVTCTSVVVPTNTTTPTPTPTPDCKADGIACSGGGGNCCSKVCSGGVCGGVTPTPTTPPSGGGVDCNTCKRGGESCGHKK